MIGALRWHKNGQELGFSLNNARGPGDCYSMDVTTGKVERWTNSETAVKTDAFPEAELVRWKSFDGKMISGFLYKPPAKFTGKRPVLVVIHGGPEGQSQPTFSGPRQLLFERAGHRADLSERARLNGIREDIFAAGQRIQARRYVQGYQCAVRLDCDAAGPGCRPHRELPAEVTAGT